MDLRGHLRVLGMEAVLPNVAARKRSAEALPHREGVAEPAAKPETEVAEAISDLDVVCDRMVRHVAED